MALDSSLHRKGDYGEKKLSISQIGENGKWTKDFSYILWEKMEKTRTVPETSPGLTVDRKCPARPAGMKNAYPREPYYTCSCFTASLLMLAD